MKKIRALDLIIGVPSVLCIFYGGPLTIVNIGKERFVFYLVMFAIGIIGLCLLATIKLIIGKNKKDQDSK